MQLCDMHIRFNGLKFYAYHGVLPQERRVGAEYTLNLRLALNFAEAATTDRIEDTVSYADVFESIKKEMDIPANLLEHAAYRIARRLLEDFPKLTEVYIELYKQNPPMNADCSQTGISLCLRK